MAISQPTDHPRLCLHAQVIWKRLEATAVTCNTAIQAVAAWPQSMVVQRTMICLDGLGRCAHACWFMNMF